MKITSFSFTIEISKDENGYSNNYYVDVTDKGVNINHPYVTQTPEQIMFVTKLVHDFIGASIDFNDRVDNFNRDNHLEQYAAIVPPQVKTTGSDFDLDANSAVVGEACPPEGSNSTQTLKVSTVEEKSLAKTIEDNVIESLGLK